MEEYTSGGFGHGGFGVRNVELEGVGVLGFLGVP